MCNLFVIMKSPLKCILLTLFAAVFLTLSKPAYADGAMGFAMETANSGVFIAKLTYGISAAAILIIETLTLIKILKCSWIRSFVIVLIVNVASALAGSVFPSSFSYGMVAFFFAAIVTVVGFIFFALCGAPYWYIIIGMLSFFLGFGFEDFVSTHDYRLSPLKLLFAVEMTLLMGFGLSLIIESMIGRIFFREKNFWKAMLLANVFSYALLVILFPFFCPNPHAVSKQNHITIQYNLREGKTDDALRILNLKRDSMQYLLGLSKSNPSPPDYQAEYEIGLVTDGIYASGETCYAIIDDTLKIPTLNSNTESLLIWLKLYYEFRYRAEQAIESKNQENLNVIYHAWIDWIDSNPCPDVDMSRIFNQDGTQRPAKVIDFILAKDESSLVNPKTTSE